VLAERVPGQIADGSMILVPVIAVMSKNQVGTQIPLYGFEEFLNSCSFVGEKPVAKILHGYFFTLGLFEE